jgi:hypothetical protein
MIPSAGTITVVIFPATDSVILSIPALKPSAPVP